MLSRKLNISCVSPLAAHVRVHFTVNLSGRNLIKFGTVGF
jgi:hypothetical protein